MRRRGGAPGTSSVVFSLSTPTHHFRRLEPPSSSQSSCGSAIWKLILGYWARRERPDPQPSGALRGRLKRPEGDARELLRKEPLPVKTLAGDGFGSTQDMVA